VHALKKKGKAIRGNLGSRIWHTQVSLPVSGFSRNSCMLNSCLLWAPYGRKWYPHNVFFYSISPIIWSPGLCLRISIEWLNIRYVNIYIYVDAVSNPITGLDRPWGFQEVEALRFQDNRHMKVVPYAPAAFTPRKYSWYSFLLEAESTPGP